MIVPTTIAWVTHGLPLVPAHPPPGPFRPRRRAGTRALEALRTDRRLDQAVGARGPAAAGARAPGLAVRVVEAGLRVVGHGGRSICASDPEAAEVGGERRRGGLDADLDVDRDRAVLGHDHRVQVHLADLGHVVGEASRREGAGPRARPRRPRAARGSRRRAGNCATSGPPRRRRHRSWARVAAYGPRAAPPRRPRTRTARADRTTGPGSRRRSSRPRARPSAARSPPPISAPRRSAIAAYAARTAAASGRRSATPPTSVLCTSSGAPAFSATG